MHFYFLFPLTFSLTLFVSAIFVWVFKRFLESCGNRVFHFLLFSVYMHEVFHFVMALLFLKWPKWDGVHVVIEQGKTRIAGGVIVKAFSYKSLFYNMINGSFILEFIYLVYELIAGFFIGFAPVIFPYLILYFVYLQQGITLDFSHLQASLQNIDWFRIFFFLPFLFFGALIASPSWADIKQTLPIFFLLFLIPVPTTIINFLFILNMVLVFGIGSVLCALVGVKIIRSR